MSEVFRRSVIRIILSLAALLALLGPASHHAKAADGPFRFYHYLIFVDAFISPGYFYYPDPWKKDGNVLWHGDGRGFWDGTGNPPWQHDAVNSYKGSSRFWNLVEVDATPDSRNPILRNWSGVGQSQEEWSRNGKTYRSTKYASNPALAQTDGWQVDGAGNVSLTIGVDGENADPLVFGAPTAKYILNIAFQDNGDGSETVSAYGFHGAYPWFETVIRCEDCDGRPVISDQGDPWLYAPADGSTPTAIFADPVYWSSTPTFNIYNY